VGSGPGTLPWMSPAPECAPSSSLAFPVPVAVPATPSPSRDPVFVEPVEEPLPDWRTPVFVPVSKRLLRSTVIVPPLMSAPFGPLAPSSACTGRVSCAGDRPAGLDVVEVVGSGCTASTGALASATGAACSRCA